MPRHEPIHGQWTIGFDVWLTDRRQVTSKANRWFALAEETQAAMRADLHQILAYAATTGAADRIRATLVYPVRRALYEDLRRYNRDETKAVISVGHRQIIVCMRAIAFGLT